MGTYYVKECKNVLLLLAQGFESLEASAFIDVFGWNSEYGTETIKLYPCGYRREVTAFFHQIFVMEYHIDEVDIDFFDALAIPGGFEEYGFYNEAYSDKFLNLIRKFHAENKFIASICVGALPVAKSGILKNKNATTYCDNPIRQQQLKEFGANVVNQPVVVDNNIITSWNPSTAVDVALLLLEKLTSKQNADNIRKLMGF